MTPSSRDLDSRLWRRALARYRERLKAAGLDRKFRRARVKALLLSLLLLPLLVPLLLLCGCIALVFPIPFIMVILEQLGPSGALGFTSLLFLAAAQLLTLWPRRELKRSQRLSVFSHLPIRDRDIAWLVTRDWFLISLPLLWIFGFFYAQIFRQQEMPIDWQAVVGLTVAQWLVCVSTIPLLATWVRERPQWVSFFLLLIAGAAFFSLGDEGLGLATRIAVCAFPTGWVNGIAYSVVIEGQTWGYWLLIPIAVWWCLGLWSQHVLADAYRIEAIILRQGCPAEATAVNRSTLSINPAAEGINHLEVITGVVVAEPDDDPLLAREQAVAKIRDRAFIDAYDWSQAGWIERLLFRWLTPRERAVIDFLTSSQIQWTQFWTGGFVQIPIFLFYWWLAIQAQGILFGFVVVVFMSGVLVSFLGPYPAFRGRSCGGVYLSQLAAFPVMRGEVERVILKVTLVRSLASLCFSLLPCAMLTLDLPFWPLEALVATGGTGVFFISLIPWLLVALYSLGSAFPDWRWRNIWRRILYIAPVVVAMGTVLVSFMIFTGRGLISPQSIAIVLSLFLCCTTLAYYWSWRFYQRGAIDLVRSSPHFWQAHMDQYEQAYVQGRRNTDMARKHGWLWWWKRELQKTETA